MDHDRTVRLVVGADVGKIKSFWQAVIHLYGSKLPFATDDIPHNKVDFWAVERGLTSFLSERDAQGRGGIAAGFFSAVPSISLSNVFRRVRVTQSHSYPEICHAQSFEDCPDQRQTTLQFLRDLFFSAETVPVILGESTNSGQAANFTRLFPSIHRPKFRKPYWQITIGAWFTGVDLNVVRAVHRLQEEAINFSRFQTFGEIRTIAAALGQIAHQFVIQDWRELTLTVVREMSRCAVQVKFANMRSKDLSISLLIKFFSDEILQTLAKGGSVRSPQDQPAAH